MKFFRLVLREISSSKTRFFAILAIFALGVGFYSGLGCAMPVMKKSMDSYADRYNLYDIRLLSQYGFDESDRDFIESVAGVSGAYLSRSVDAQVNGAACRFMSLTDGVNTPRIIEGRLPQSPGECALGRNTMSGTLAKIGGKITIAEQNSAEIKDSFAKTEFTVVGIVESPAFPSVQRGATSVGQGSLSHYAYIMDGDFTGEYYTEAYVTVSGVKNARLYSDEYKDITDGATSALEQSGLENVQLSRVKSKAQGELDGKKAEYEQKKADAEKELDKAKQKLDDAKSELNLAKGQIEQSERRLTLARAEYEQNKTESEAQLKAAQDELDGNYAALAAAFGNAAAAEQTETAAAELAAARAQAEQRLSEALAQITQGQTQLEAARAEYNAGLAEYNAGLSEYNKQNEKAQKELYDAQAELERAQAQIDELKAPEIYLFNLTDNYGVNAFCQDADRINNIAKVFPILFFVVAALVCLTTMTRMIDEQRTKIGTLSALGYGSGTIAAHYLCYSSLAAAAGGIVGAAAGCIVIPLVIFNTYKILYSLPGIVFTVDIGKTCGAIAAALILTCGVTLWAGLSSLKSCAAQLMRPAAPKEGKKVALEHIGFIWKRLSFTSKVTVRNLFRYKKRFLMTVIGIAGCCALLLTGFGLKDSISDMVPLQYGDIQRFDMTVYLTEDSDKVRKTVEEGADDCLFVQNTATYAENGDRSLECRVVVPENPEKLGDYISLKNRKSGAAVEFPADGSVVIAEKLSIRLGLDIGDSIGIQKEGGGSASLTVSGITENYIYNYIYMSPETYESAFGEKIRYNEAFVKSDGEIAAGGGIASVMRSKDMTESFSHVFDSLNGVVLLLIISACLLNFVVLYNLTNINIGERVREIATIKVLGFYRRETDAYIYRENLLLTLIGTAAGLALGIYLHRFVISTAEIDMIMFTRTIKPLSFVLSAALTFAFSALVNGTMHFKLDRISMTESLKSTE